MILQNIIIARLENLKHELPALVKELRLETAVAMKKYNLTEQQAKALYTRSVKKKTKRKTLRR